MSLTLSRPFDPARRIRLRWPPPRRLGISLLTLGALLTLWWLVARLGLISPLFLPPPAQVLQQFATLTGPQGFMDATLWQHLAASLQRILIALAAATLCGVTVGLAMGLSPTLRGMLDPLIELYRPVPPLAYLPLMVIWFGIGETSKVLLIYLAIFAPVAMATLAGVQDAKQVRLRAAGRSAPTAGRCSGMSSCPAPCRTCSPGCVSGSGSAGPPWWRPSSSPPPAAWASWFKPPANFLPPTWCWRAFW